MDKASGYLKMFNVKDIKSSTLLDHFKPWLLRLEARTEKKVKYFTCDQSFDGPIQISWISWKKKESPN